MAPPPTLESLPSEVRFFPSLALLLLLKGHTIERLAHLHSFPSLTSPPAAHPSYALLPPPRCYRQLLPNLRLLCRPCVRRGERRLALANSLPLLLRRSDHQCLGPSTSSFHGRIRSVEAARSGEGGSEVSVEGGSSSECDCFEGMEGRQDGSRSFRGELAFPSSLPLFPLLFWKTELPLSSYRSFLGL